MKIFLVITMIIVVGGMIFFRALNYYNEHIDKTKDNGTVIKKRFNKK